MNASFHLLLGPRHPAIREVVMPQQQLRHRLRAHNLRVWVTTLLEPSGVQGLSFGQRAVRMGIECGILFSGVALWRRTLPSHDVSPSRGDL